MSTPEKPGFTAGLKSILKRITGEKGTLERIQTRLNEEKEMLNKISVAEKEYAELSSRLFELGRAIFNKNMEYNDKSSRLQSSRNRHPHDDHSAQVAEVDGLYRQSEEMEEEQRQKQARLEEVREDINRMRTEGLAAIRKGCSFDEVAAMQKQIGEAETTVVKLRESIATQEQKRAGLETKPTAELETSMEDLHAARALEQLSEEEHTQKVGEITAQISAAHEHNSRISLAMTQAKGAIASLGRQLSTAEGELNEIKAGAQRAKIAFLEADALALVEDYLEKASAAKDAFIRLEGMERVLIHAGSNRRLLPDSAKHLFFLVNPISGANATGGTAMFQADYAYMGSGGDVFGEACEQEIKRLRDLGVGL